jgi:U4/U6 small nuclear ribonucleoprotein PRP31
MLSIDELKEIEEACDMAIEVHSFKQKILDYVEARMAFIAPNLSAIVGASTAAKLMGKLKQNKYNQAISNLCSLQYLGAT